MNPLNNYSYKGNFWIINPTLIPVFQDIYNSDKSKNKEVTSKIMWGIAFLLERENNKYVKASYEDKLDLIKSDIIEDEKFDWNNTLVKKTIDKYSFTLIDALERQVTALEGKMDERTKFMIDTKYDLDNASELDKMFTNTLKLQELLEEAKKRLIASKENTDEGIVKGGRTESLSEKGLI
jgi:hypothetical protein